MSSVSTRIPLDGQRFGKRTVLRYSHSIKGRAYWIVRCDCGTLSTVTGTQLRIGRSKQCLRCCGKLNLDLTGQRFGAWIVEAFSHKNARGASYWSCRCDCGAINKVHGGSLIRQRSTHCSKCTRFGPRAIAAALENHKYVHGHAAGKASPTYRSWRSMIQRCTNPKAAKFKYYGGRGVLPCQAWLDFTAFLSDMGVRPEGTTLDRIDNDLGYFKGNCRWATPKQQTANRRRTKHKGKG